MPIAEFTLGNALLTVLSIFFVVIWIWILVVILSDLFRDSELSGWWKAVWVLLLVGIPVLTVLIYLVARGQGMRERTIQAQAEAREQFDSYVREASAAGSPADELAKLSDLKDRGAITDGEYEAAKAKLLG